MERLMSEKNILLIVEGERREKEFFNQVSKTFGLKFTIYTYKTNIYSLYSRLKNYDFNADIIGVLNELNNKQINEKLLDKRFAYVYLIFDFDIQHNSQPGLFDYSNLKKNINQLKEMANYFNNETDPTIGKLYINFPMFESYRDIDSFDDFTFKNRICEISELKSYKEKTSHKKITNIRISSFSKFNFEQLAFLNLLKLNYLINGIFASPSLEEYQLISLLELVKCEEDFVYKGFVSVVNCSALFIIDYFGNKNNYYNNLIDNLNRQLI